MLRWALCYLLIVGLLAGPGPLAAEQVASDPDVAKGVSQVDEGDYDGAILTLDNAARRLVADPSKARDLSEAYLYLGIAYMGKGHESAAKAKFRDAISQIHDLSLSPEKFSPRVINVFEQARDEVIRPAPVEPSPTPAPRPASETKPPAKSGSSKGLLIAGGLVAVGGGVALAAKGGGGSNPTPAPSPTPAARQTVTFPPGSLANHDGLGVTSHKVVVTANGTLDASVTWLETGSVVSLSLGTATTTITDSGQTSATSSSLSGPVTPQTYTINVKLQSGSRATYTLTVVFP